MISGTSTFRNTCGPNFMNGANYGILMTDNMKRKILGILTILMLIFIWGHSLVPMEQSATESEWFRTMIINPVLKFLGLGEMSSHAVRKAAHMTEFAVLGLLLFMYWENRCLPSLSCGVLAAAIDETIQVFSSRGASLTDVLIDTAGVIIALLLCLVVTEISDRIKKR